MQFNNMSEHEGQMQEILLNLHNMKREWAQLTLSEVRICLQ